MIASIATPSLAKTPALPNLRPLRFDDYRQIEKLESSEGLLTPGEQDWQEIWAGNPLRRRLRSDWPMGWVLEDAGGRVVGSLANIPTRYAFRGQELIAVTGRGWVVAPEYRGVALWLMDEYFNQDGVDLFINNTVNALAVEAFATFGSQRVPVGDWETAAYWITGYSGFARTALRLKNVPLAKFLAPGAGLALRVKDAFTAPSLPAPNGSYQFHSECAFDDRFDTFWQELVQQNPDKLLCVRDTETLNWHFAGQLRTGQVCIVTAARNGLLRAYCILKRQDHPPSGLIRMRLVDYQSLDADEEEVLEGLLSHAIGHCASEGIYSLEHVGCNLPKMRAFDRLAPYRRKLPAWPYYYSAVDPALNLELRNPERWDPSAYDGDASL